MSEFKVDDKVVLRPETKPYTFLNNFGCEVETYITINEEVYSILRISSDGNIVIGQRYVQHFHINPRHLKHAEPTTKVEGVFDDFQSREIPSYDIDTTELRLSIFNGDTSRTLEEMQAIENWLSGDK